jgi:hypothetical protein
MDSSLKNGKKDREVSKIQLTKFCRFTANKEAAKMTEVSHALGLHMHQPAIPAGSQDIQKALDNIKASGL